jgi:hypothetical protein
VIIAFYVRTKTAIFKLISGILNSLNQKMLVGGIFCELEKAFDCVSHEILLNKLRYYGIKDRQYNLYKSYLQDTFQITTYGGEVSMGGYLPHINSCLFVV